jgi:hypothetical protein
MGKAISTSGLRRIAFGCAGIRMDSLITETTRDLVKTSQNPNIPPEPSDASTAFTDKADGKPGRVQMKFNSILLFVAAMSIAEFQAIGQEHQISSTVTQVVVESVSLTKNFHELDRASRDAPEFKVQTPYYQTAMLCFSTVGSSMNCRELQPNRSSTGQGIDSGPAKSPTMKNNSSPDEISTYTLIVP